MGGETEKEILGILEEAIKREQAASKLYRRGMELAENQKVKGVFAMLAKEEEGHEKILKGIYHDFKKELGLKILKDTGE